MFGKKNAALLEEADTRIKQLNDKLEWYQRHYEKQQGYIEELYDVVGDLSRQLGLVLKSENIERVQRSPYLEETSDFFLDLYVLFNTRLKKGKNVTCYFGKELEELRRKFEDRDFRNSEIINLTERLTLGNLCSLFKRGLWRGTVEDSLKALRAERGFDEQQH